MSVHTQNYSQQFFTHDEYLIVKLMVYMCMYILIPQTTSLIQPIITLIIKEFRSFIYCDSNAAS